MAATLFLWDRQTIIQDSFGNRKQSFFPMNVKSTTNAVPFWFHVTECLEMKPKVVVIQSLAKKSGLQNAFALCMLASGVVLERL